MFNLISNFIICNIINITLFIHIIITFLFFSFLEKKYKKIIDYNFYYYYIFCYIFYGISYRLLLELFQCIIFNRYPKKYNIKRIFINTTRELILYPSPNTNLS